MKVEPCCYFCRHYLVFHHLCSLLQLKLEDGEEKRHICAFFRPRATEKTTWIHICGPWSCVRVPKGTPVEVGRDAISSFVKFHVDGGYPVVVRRLGTELTVHLAMESGSEILLGRLSCPDPWNFWPVKLIVPGYMRPQS